MILLCILSSSAFSQKRELTGVVSDKSGIPLNRATITIKGEKTSTITDANGIFTITVNTADAILVISYVGAKNIEISTAGKTNLLATLDVDTKMSEVVVVGYGKSRRADLTTAQTSISAKEIDRTLNTTVEQAIQGRSAGVYVTQNSGQPGGGISVKIRGVNSINGNTDPLYVIDGVQIRVEGIAFGPTSSSNPLAGLNPADIDDIQILQGPSATAIYGTAGANGVVMITTKRGKSGNAKITYGLQYSIQTAPPKLDVMNLRQYAQMVKEFHAVQGGTTPIEFLDPSLLGEGTDWQKELFKSTPMSKHQLSVSGGNDKTTYYFSGEYLNQDGVAVGSGFKRYGFRVNLDNKLRDWATLGINISANQTKEILTSSQENIISNALQLTPQVPVKNLDGSWGGGDITNGANQFAPVNPIAIGNLKTNNNTRRQLLGGLNLALNLAKGLTFRTSLNANAGYSNSMYYQPTYAIGWAINVTASLDEGTGNNTYYNWNQQLQYYKQFKKHTVDAMVTHEAQEWRWKNVSARRTGFLTNNIFDLQAGDPLTSATGGGSGYGGVESYLGRVSYNYDNRYIVMGTFRADGSASFGANNKWAYFPSASAAWRISQEKFFNVPAISELKLRFETGIVGNSSVGGSGIYSPLSTGATPGGTGFLPASFSNPDLKWEETQSYNAGINLGVLKNRITFEFDYFVKNTSNLIINNVPLPWYQGTNGTGAVGAPTVNVGKLENKGWGLTINTVNVSNKDFKWESNINLSAFKTKVNKIYSDASLLDRTSWWLENWTQRTVVGRAPWQFRGYIEEGLFQTIDEINNSAVPVDNNGQRLPVNQATGLWVGDVKYKDISGPQGIPDGKIDTYDETFIGNPWPKLFGGFTNSISYKGFDVSILITGTFGNDIYNYLSKLNTNANNINISRNLLVHAMDYAKPGLDKQGNPILLNPGTDVPRLSYGPNGNYSRPTSKWVEDGSFVRLKNISVSYNLPAKIVAKQKIIKSMRFTVGAQNILTITGYKGYDPEVGAYVGRDASAGNQAIGLDYGRYPLTPIYTFNLGVNF
jgi:TonB-dependent starch-binding outer membrane protein SusC